ncbi:hypothetical protein BsWGS_05536 [Bradybaena similaris]
MGFESKILISQTELTKQETAVLTDLMYVLQVTSCPKHNGIISQSKNNIGMLSSRTELVLQLIPAQFPFPGIEKSFTCRDSNSRANFHQMNLTDCHLQTLSSTFQSKFYENAQILTDWEEILPKGAAICDQLWGTREALKPVSCL